MASGNTPDQVEVRMLSNADAYAAGLRGLGGELRRAGGTVEVDEPPR